MAVRPAGAFTAMSNVLDQSIQQQVVALGRLGWSLRRIEAATGVRRETISGYLKAAGIAVRRRGGRPGLWPPANPATTAPVSTDPGTTPGTAAATVTPGRAPTASACEPYRELIVEGVRRGRNAMAIFQDVVDGHGFPGRYASVRRFVARLRGTATPEPAGISATAPGEDRIGISIGVGRVSDAITDRASTDWRAAACPLTRSCASRAVGTAVTVGGAMPAGTTRSRRWDGRPRRRSPRGGGASGP